MPDINGNYDQPTHAGSTRMGRNKELTDDFTLLEQAGQAIGRARKSASGPLAAGDYGTGKKVVTDPPLRV